MAAIKRERLWGFALLVGISGMGLLAACGGGDSSAPPPAAGTPAGIVYTAVQDTANVRELYRVAFATPGVSTKLNPALPAGRDVSYDFVVTPDGTAVLYRADQDTARVHELYRVAFATPGVSTKLNGPLVANGRVDRFCVNSPCR